MTTIAANRTSMAADSKVTDGGVSYNTDKIFEINGSLVGVAGDVSYTNQWMEWFAAGCPDGAGSLGKKSFCALVLSPKGLFYYPDRCKPDTILNDFYGIGAGAMAAATAMHLGKTPTEAVEIACVVNATDSGPPVKTLELPAKRGRR